MQIPAPLFDESTEQLRTTQFLEVPPFAVIITPPPHFVAAQIPPALVKPLAEAEAQSNCNTRYLVFAADGRSRTTSAGTPVELRKVIADESTISAPI